jgi:hypothetical protein
MQIRIRLVAATIARKLLLIVAVLVVLSLVGRFLLFYAGSVPGVKPLVRQFYLDEESNIPALYSAIALAFASGLLFLISRFERLAASVQAKSWQVLAGIFLYLALDELNSFHEILIGPVRNRLGLSGLFYFAWVVPAMGLVLLFVCVFLNFLQQLNRTTQVQFIAAGGIFVLGALGFEMLNGAVYERLGDVAANFDPLYQALMTAEELLEMLGVVLFIYALVAYLNRYHDVRELVLWLPTRQQPSLPKPDVTPER